MAYYTARELRTPRSYRLKVAPPFNVNFPSVIYRVTVRPVAGAPVWKLEAEALDGSGSRILCESGPSASNLEREIFRAGFELLHPTAGSGIMEKLCAEGRAERIERAKGGETPLLRD
jgi:hypothetical protein